MKKANLPSFAACILPAIGIILAVSGCERQQTKPTTHSVWLSTMTNITAESLAELTDTTPFQANILGVTVEESSNGFAAHGIGNRTTIITNHYLISFRDPKGRARVIQGFNVTDDDLRLVKRLEKGNYYVFPEALLR